MKRQDLAGACLCLAAALLATAGAGAATPRERVLLWGDTHLHTTYSVDAFLFMNRSADPDTAYRYARGLPVIHPYHRARVRIETPLDFLVVSDHAELMAVPKRIFEGEEIILKTAFGRNAAQMIKEGREADFFAAIVAGANSGEQSDALELITPEIRTPPWRDIAAAADRNNQPGTFTALIGWEWSSIPDAANLHRVVFMDKGAEAAAKFLPFSSTDSVDPEDLWAWLEETEKATGANFVAIPHNMNISKGKMFDAFDSKGRPIDAAYARTRSRWEPVAEVTQIKGDSETHPLLSPNDEFADFETYRFLIDTRPDTDHTAPVTAGDYARAALLRGLGIGRHTGVNPYKFGMIGSTDSHTGLSSAEENNFHGKMALDSVPERKSQPRIGKQGATGWDMSASGLAAVWAEDNTREAIVAAFRRREVYATTGPRIRARLFAGWEFGQRDLDAEDMARIGYARGVPMGGELSTAPRGKAPALLLQATRDPKGANLDRIQVVKGWIDAQGATQERVYNVIGSDGRRPGPDGNLPPVGSTLDLGAASYTNAIGAAELAAFWVDPDFDPAVPSFYYARVLQIPTPRHSLYDAVALAQPHIDGKPPSIQERAYTSPVWYTP